MTKNTNISCNVTECNHHEKKENYCTLPKIVVIKNTTTADSIECTDCGSFKR